jgi:hypothetical protein
MPAATLPDDAMEALVDEGTRLVVGYLTGWFRRLGESVTSHHGPTR